MGNNPSRATTPTSNPQSPASATASHGSATIHPNHSVRREPRRRESIQALSNVKATAAPPSASLESATAHSSTVRQHSRSRSQTTSAALVTPQLRPHDIPIKEKPTLGEKMGNEQSTEKLARGPTPPSARPSPLSKPVDVPAPSAENYSRFESSVIDPAASSQEAYYIPPSQSQYTRPPRLPLPIEEEVHTPGSPIISPADLSAPLDPVDVDGILPRRSSVLSSTTVDDDDLGDGLLQGDDSGARPAVPTLIEWTQGGERVYVTGTFAGNWDRKYRLHKDGPSKHKDALSAMINLVPGTHHLKFIVDGEMRLSDSLPTAVDFTNILVNYIEISPDDLPQPPAAVGVPSKQPEPAPVPEIVIPPGLYPPQVLPPTPELRPVAPKASPQPITEARTLTKPVPVAPSSPKHYHQVIPRYLADLDAPEESQRFNRANAAVSNLPTPPTLPMFLSKSILNGTTPMKDDSSVLIMPNHTVLNHLATSSIKSNVLATSATTRYKRKFLTTILYKPTTVNGE
ncbi:carbohydrate-binding module family 48 protein [Glonium stellatum]|uniref:Carbohydrate-binding module family 48 protein n=1 Tax=Glonium stellatum TaxID=574774 RepID=A0A8E2JPM8_9PEZI|nr:carbohydrate-binding module family 48 protein [Glonium stellatum]